MKTAELLRIEFQSEMDTKVFNEQGEIDIDYVLWLENKVIAQQLPSKQRIKERPNIKIKIKGDAGLYTVWGIDWLNHKMLVERACGYEQIAFDKISSELSADAEPTPMEQTREAFEPIQMGQNMVVNKPDADEPTGELYQKVYITTEADLPKDNANYACKVAGNDKMYVFNGQIVRDYGLSIDWYLQPIEPSEPVTEKSISLPTKETVIEQSKEFHKVHGGYHPDFAKGAEWMRGKAKAIDLKTELKNFNDWMCRSEYDGLIPLIETCIDEYLQSKLSGKCKQ